MIRFAELGIEFHEGGELERSAWCFEQSTKRDGGCGAGFLMYGLALRHGWVSTDTSFNYPSNLSADTVI